MFQSCSTLTTLNISNFDTSDVNDMGYMFHGCTGLTTLDLSSFDFGNVSGFSSILEGCSNLISITARTEADKNILAAKIFYLPDCTITVKGT